MSLDTPPTHIQRILERPGADWMPREREEILNWLAGPQQRQALEGFCAHHLGGGVPDEEKRDAVSAFFVTRLNDTVRRFSPARGAFQGLLLLSLKQHAWRWATKVRKRAEEALAPGAEDGVATRPAFDRFGSTPDADRISALVDCLRHLPSVKRMVVLMTYRDEHEDAQIAGALGLSRENVRVQRFRCLRLLRGCLEKKGVARWSV